MRTRLLALLLLVSGCQKQAAAPAAPAPAPAGEPALEAAVDDGHIATLVDVMKKKLAPFASRKSNDEEAFRYALSQLREMAPPDSPYNQGPRPWYQIVDDMLATRDYRRGCQECHRAYKRSFKDRYGDGEVVWVDPPKPGGK